MDLEAEFLIWLKLANPFNILFCKVFFQWKFQFEDKVIFVRFIFVWSALCMHFGSAKGKVLFVKILLEVLILNTLICIGTDKEWFPQISSCWTFFHIYNTLWEIFLTLQLFLRKDFDQGML